MIRFLLAIAALALTTIGAFAQTGLTFVPLGYCQLSTLTASTALSSCSGGIPAGATRAIFLPEAQAIRYRDDGTAPTAAIGMPAAVAAAPVNYSGTLSKLRFIEQTSGAKLNVLFYR